MVTLAHDNPYPSVLMVEGDPEALEANPAVGQRRLAVGTDHLLYLVDDAGAATLVGASSGLSDPLTTRGDIMVRDASNVTARLAIGSSGTVLRSDGTDISWQTPAGAALTYLSNVLSGNVTLTTQNTFYDGPAVTLAVGTWLLTGVVDIVLTGITGVNVAVAKLWDGTTVANSGEASTGVTGSDGYRRMQIRLSAVVVIASGTPTWKISVVNNSGNGGSILAATASNGSGNNSSRLDAIQIA